MAPSAPAATPTLGLDRAVEIARGIQGDLDAGRLAVPYPPHVHQALAECLAAFSDYATTPERAREILRRISESEEASLPW